MRKILIVCGARPNFIKIAPLIRALKELPSLFSISLVHTGQHFDNNMNKVFFKQLNIPAPDYFFDIYGGTHSYQTGKIMIEFEKVILKEKPNIVLVIGDVNSTMACAITSKKCGYKLGHIESGLRSGDMEMPEEINRIITDSIADYFFVTEKSAINNLLKEGKSKNQIFFVGNIMIDSLKNEAQIVKKGAAINEKIVEIVKKYPNYILVTIHRPSNVDSKKDLLNLLGILDSASSLFEIIFPVHPRTKKQFEKFNINLPSKINFIDPVPYREFVFLMMYSKCVITDSGGIQEETTALKKTCFTLRNNTERPITCEIGSNKLIGNYPKNIIEEIKSTFDYKKEYSIPKFWDGNTSKRICEILKNLDF